MASEAAPSTPPNPNSESDSEAESWRSGYDSNSDSELLLESTRQRTPPPSTLLRTAVAQLFDAFDTARDFKDKSGVSEINILIDMFEQGTFVPPLRETAEEYMLFGARNLHRFLDLSDCFELEAPLYVAKDSSWAGDVDRDRGFLVLEYFRIIYFAQFNLKARWEAGLLRDGQIALVEVVLKRLMGELQLVIDWFDSENESDLFAQGETAMQLEEMSLSIPQLWHPHEVLRASPGLGLFSLIRARVALVVCSGLVDFLSCVRFRSERLENLILKYLNEDTAPNLEIVKEIQRLTVRRKIQPMPYSAACVFLGNTASRLLTQPPELRPNEKEKPTVRPFYCQPSARSGDDYYHWLGYPFVRNSSNRRGWYAVASQLQ